MIADIEIPIDPEWPSRVAEHARANVQRWESCTQSVVAALLDELGIDEPVALRAGGAFHGGMLTSGTCGAVTGGLIVLGLLIGRERLEDGMDALFPVVLPAQKMQQRVKALLGTTSCRELSGVDFTNLAQAMRFMRSGDNARCHEVVATAAEEIARVLQELAAAGELFRVVPESRAGVEVSRA